ncbi:unnamed protein product [Linum tenue]|uniref:Uncharacterized protein n=1 Tax=Linum tenue TaxID=586396 RepID=A0AAV0P127_9ROSI|nr:unnamed protein product [Linum tenue]
MRSRRRRLGSGLGNKGEPAVGGWDLDSGMNVNPSSEVGVGTRVIVDLLIWKG